MRMEAARSENAQMRKMSMVDRALRRALEPRSL
jgi:hypothetical protein